MAATRTALRLLPDLLQTAVATRVMPVLRSLARAAIDTVFPPACLNCRQSTGAANALCASCWAQVRFIERPFSEHLGMPFAMDLGNDGLLSPEAVADPPVFARARAVAQQLVHRLKYNDRMELAKPLGAWMARAGNEILAEADLLVPVPLHRRRLAAPQFNQALWRNPSQPNAASLPILSSSRGSSRRLLKLGSRVRSGHSIYRARFA
jgi:Double zinc ribbon domain